MNIDFPAANHTTVAATRRVKYEDVLYSIVSIKIRIIPDSMKNVTNTFGIRDSDVVCLGFSGRPTEADLKIPDINFGALIIDLTATKINDAAASSTQPNSFEITDPMIAAIKAGANDVAKPEIAPTIEDLNGAEGRDMIPVLEEFIKNVLAFNNYRAAPDAVCNMKIAPTMMCL